MYQFAIKNQEYFEECAKKSFDEIDSNGDNRIDLEEFYVCMKKVAENLGFEVPSLDESRQVVQQYDINKNGTLDFNEFKELFKQILISIPNI